MPDERERRAEESYAEYFERSATTVLFDDLGDADDDDDIRSVALIESCLEVLHANPKISLHAPGIDYAQAIVTLESMRDRRVTVGELRAGIRLRQAELAAA